MYCVEFTFHYQHKTKQTETLRSPCRLSALFCLFVCLIDVVILSTELTGRLFCFLCVCFDYRNTDYGTQMKNDYDTSKDDKKKAAEENGVTTTTNKQKDAAAANNGGGASAASNKNKEESDAQDKLELLFGGHLRDRLANFDARTDCMQSDWYMAFEVVRQGSLLPGGLARSRRRNADEKAWDQIRKANKTRGRPKSRNSGTWESLSSASVQFLHWLGFDSNSALPPPSDDVAQALAFLGYDFFGKIVEKAIFLRSLREEGGSLKQQPKVVPAKDATSTASLSASALLEMKEGKQLTAGDIETALNDTTLSIKPIYNAVGSGLGTAGDGRQQALQLYFGPGFEERLEMELET
jgi:hypothetical protein